MEDKKAMRKAVVLVSGGMDSAVCLFECAREGLEVHALSFDYGQRGAKVEMDAVRQLHNAAMKAYGSDVVNPANYVHLKLPTFADATKSRDALTFYQTPVKTDGVGTHDLHRTDDRLPSSFVPGRNAIFLAYAFALAHNVGADRVFIGVNTVDFSGYPDCRQDFLADIDIAMNSALGDEADEIYIVAPLIDLTKSEIVKSAVELGVPLALTSSCYQPEGVLPDGRVQHCGVCDSCRLRRKGFEDATIEDPTVYVG